MFCCICISWYVWTSFTLNICLWAHCDGYFLSNKCKQVFGGYWVVEIYHRTYFYLFSHNSDVSSVECVGKEVWKLYVDWTVHFERFLYIQLTTKSFLAVYMWQIKQIHGPIVSLAIKILTINVMSDPKSCTSFQGVLMIKRCINFLLEKRIIFFIIKILPVIDITWANSG